MSPSRHHTMLGVARRLLLVTLIPVAASAGEPRVSPDLARLHDVVVVSGPEATTIHLKTSSRARYQAQFIDSPARLVVDLEDTAFAWRQGPLDVAAAPLRQVRGSQYRKGVARVVVEFTRHAPYTIKEAANELVIVVPGAAREATVGARSGASRVAGGGRSPVEAAAPIVQAAQLLGPTALPARQSGAPTGAALDPALRGGVLVAQAPAPRPPAASAPANGRLISLDFKDADVVNLLRILAAETTMNIIISDDVKGKMSITLRNVPWEQAMEIVLESRGLEKIVKGNVMRIVSREQLAREREAQAKIQEARVKAEEAKAKADSEIRQKVAEAALKEQEVQARRLAAEQAIAETQARGPLVEETIRLAYSDPDEVVKTLIGLLGITEGAAAPPAPVVPPAGPPFSALYAPPAPGTPPTQSPETAGKGITIKAHKPTNSIFVRHYTADVERIKKLIREKLDVQLPQIKIEARLNEVSRRDLIDFGIQWGGGFAGRAGNNVLVGSGRNPAPTGGIPALGVTTGQTNPNVTLATALPVSAASGLPAGGNIVNLPIANIPTFGIGFGVIGTRFAWNVALQALEEQGKTRSLARPEIVTVENAKATISLGSEIPYQTVSSAGTSVSFKEATLKLEVTPTVIREPEATKIKMKLIVEDNSRGIDVPSGTAGGTLPTINKRRAETEVIVKEGEALVIGGIHQRAEVEAVQKVPLLGDIPVLGWLFKRRSFTVDPNRELIIFISPTVLKDPPKGTAPSAPPAR